MKLPSAVLTLVASFVLFAFSALATDAPPPFPGQPKMNAALKHLTGAQVQAESNANGALSELEGAIVALTDASHNKGTYRTIALDLAARAKRNLEKGNVAMAKHEIDEAITAVNRGGDIGDHRH